MTNKTTRKAFTLIEVLVALLVLSISLTSVYALLQTSIDTTGFAKDKVFVIEKGYDRIIRQINYPSKVFSDTETYDEIVVNYKFERKTTPVPMLTEIHMTVSTDKASTIFIYYIQDGSL